MSEEAPTELFSVASSSSCFLRRHVCVCRLLLWRGCNPRLRQTLQVVEPAAARHPEPQHPARLGWSSRLEQDTQEGVTVEQQLVPEQASQGWGRGARARAPKSALRNYPVPLLGPASRARGGCKVAQSVVPKTVQISSKTFSCSTNTDIAEIHQVGWRVRGQGQ